jgi:hypothetical protein
MTSHQKHYFVKYHSDSMHNYSKVDIKNMLEFLIDNIYVVVRGQVFQLSVGIPMGTNCARLLANLFLYSYEAEFIQKLLHDEKKKSLAVAFNSNFDISTTFCPLTIIISILMSIRYIPMN